LGEATHSDKTTFAFNINVLKYLVSEKEFITLIIKTPNTIVMPFQLFLKKSRGLSYAAA